MTTDNAYLDIQWVRTFIKDVCMGVGVPKDDAQICADVMITADLRGIESHGVQRLKSYYYDPLIDDRQEAVTKINVLKESPTTARLDAGHGMGQVAAFRAMELAIKKAKEYGTGAVSVGNSTHYGIAGYYPLMAVQKDMIGFTVTNTRPLVVPTFGVEPMMGTNPISIGCPTDEPFPFLLDMATSIVPQGKIEVLARTETPIPEGWVMNDQGDLATESVQTLKDLIEGRAGILPVGGAGEMLGGHKGYGLSVVVEILSAALWGGPFMHGLTDIEGHQLGHFFFVINPESFIELSTFKKVAGDICRSLRAAKKVPDQDRIYTAGEKEYYAELERRKTGIPLNNSVQQEFLFLNSELGLDYKFNF